MDDASDHDNHDATVLRAESSLRSRESTATNSDASGGGDVAEIPNVLKQRFVLEDKLGAGGMGTVYQAKDLRKVEARDKQPHVAIKVLNNNFRTHPEAFIALEREASKSQSLRHSNIVSIFDFDKDGSIPFITMELLEGKELGELMKAYPTGLPDEVAWSVVKGMIAGLVHAHEEGVVHADFKPGNVFVSSDNVAKILDFGIARAMRANADDLNSDSHDTEFDPARLAALTPAYASREMLNGDTPDPRDDLYSLAIVIYMVFTGHHPYGRLNANDAAADRLKPERIKRLSRRQWKALERGLAFNRQDRPLDAEEIYEAFFGKSSWHSWSVAAGLAALTIALVVTSISGSEELDQVKDEVRQSTLVDAQIARITELIDTPRFDEDWNRRLFSELQTLKTLAPSHEFHASATARLSEVFTDAIEEATGERAFTLFEAGLRFTPLVEAKAVLERALVREADELLRAAPSAAWVARVSDWMARCERYFPDSVDVSVKHLEIVDVLGGAIPSLSEESVETAEVAYALYAEHSFDSEELDSAEDEITSAVAQQHQEEEDRQFAVIENALVARVGDLVDVSCLRLDVGLLANELRAIQDEHGMHFEAVHERIRPRIAECVKRLGAVDPDRAQSLQRNAIAQLGSWLSLDVMEIDPCAMDYLVGNGQQRGRAGYCSDKLEGDTGPRLVVVPGDEHLRKFAISKYEVSWSEFARFCGDTGRCAVAEESELPITNVSIEDARAYAEWLSRKTGYVYRLPKLHEWTRVAKGEPDPNRNCRIDVAGISRGYNPLPINTGDANELGIYHILGNVQELVEIEDSPDDYVAVGGAYADPIESCSPATRRSVASGGDERTGFRVVREVS